MKLTSQNTHWTKILRQAIDYLTPNLPGSVISSRLLRNGRRRYVIVGPSYTYVHGFTRDMLCDHLRLNYRNFFVGDVRSVTDLKMLHGRKRIEVVCGPIGSKVQPKPITKLDSPRVTAKEYLQVKIEQTDKELANLVAERDVLIERKQQIELEESNRNPFKGGEAAYYNDGREDLALLNQKLFDTYSDIVQIATNSTGPQYINRPDLKYKSFYINNDYNVILHPVTKTGGTVIELQKK